ncbi:hypothetical protein [Zunongwangia atlantica]|uniref:N-acetyltransferase domain-containing protein n=1 Tax=Zunongwangia atlantica 22II14-10F7 TaxID=1185767 RepID=A0A1Y1T703_9FLAO|nr:hypothetical protein [Zunongwangia atlantica]ORL46847.1 hypothetical protein IIF7_02476 [Zunongwangia atlantica 22II14-10F7]
MILERTNNLALDIKELNAMNLENIASTFLPKTNTNNEQTDPYVSKLLTFLKAELNLENHQTKNYHLLWSRDQETIGFVSVTAIREGKEAKIKFRLFDHVNLSQQESENSIISSVDKIFEKFDLKRAIISVDTDKENQPEKDLLRLYEYYPIGMVHLENPMKEYVILREQKNTASQAFYIL